MKPSDFKPWVNMKTVSRIIFRYMIRKKHPPAPRHPQQVFKRVLIKLSLGTLKTSVKISTYTGVRLL